MIEVTNDSGTLLKIEEHNFEIDGAKKSLDYDLLHLLAEKGDLEAITRFYEQSVREDDLTKSNDIPLRTQTEHVRVSFIVLPVIGYGPLHHCQMYLNELNGDDSVQTHIIIGGHGERTLDYDSEVASVVKLPPLQYSQDISQALIEEKIATDEVTADYCEEVIERLSLSSPNVVVIHNMFAGFFDSPPVRTEVIGAVTNWCKENKIPIVDCAMDNQNVYIKNDAQQKKFLNAINNSVSAVAVRGPYVDLFESSTPLISTPEFESLRNKIVPLGYMQPTFTQPPSKEIFDILFPKQVIAISAGGSDYASGLFNKSLEAYVCAHETKSQISSHPWVIFVGAHLSQEDSDKLKDIAQKTTEKTGTFFGHDLRIYPALPPGWYYQMIKDRTICAITQAGQTTVSILNDTGVPLVMSPYTPGGESSPEQQRRADYYEKVLERSFTFPVDESPQFLHDLICNAVTKGPCTAPTDLNGGARLAKLVKHLAVGYSDIKTLRDEFISEIVVK